MTVNLIYYVLSLVLLMLMGLFLLADGFGIDLSWKSYVGILYLFLGIIRPWRDLL